MKCSAKRLLLTWNWSGHTAEDNSFAWMSHFAFTCTLTHLRRHNPLSISHQRSELRPTTSYLIRRQFIISQNLSCSLCTPYASDFYYNSELCHIQKFTDNTTIMGCIWDDQEKEYRSLVRDIAKQVTFCGSVFHQRSDSLARPSNYTCAKA